MDSVQGKVSYLQGLAKGLNFSSQSVEGKLLLNMVDVLDSVAQELQDIHLAQKDLEDYVDNMDEDLEHLENIIYEDEEASVLQLECPNCNADIVIEGAEIDEAQTAVTCPSCGTTIHDYYQSGSGHFARGGHPGI